MNTCEHCNQTNASVEWVANPFIYDLLGETQMEYICSDCYFHLCGDI